MDNEKIMALLTDLFHRASGSDSFHRPKWDELREEIRRLLDGRNELHEWREREAACCPEDASFEDVMTLMRMLLRTAHMALRQLDIVRPITVEIGEFLALAGDK